MKDSWGGEATIHKLIAKGNRVTVRTLAYHAAARNNLSDTLLVDQAKAFEIMEVQKSYAADFPSIQMNTIPHFHLVQFIESAIEDWKADSICL